MHCFLTSVIAIGASVWIVRLLIGMQQTTPDKRFFKTFDEVLTAYRGTSGWPEFALLVLSLWLSLTKKGVIGYASLIIASISVIVSAMCGQDWLAILNALPRVIKEVRGAFH